MLEEIIKNTSHINQDRKDEILNWVKGLDRDKYMMIVQVCHINIMRNDESNLLSK